MTDHADRSAGASDATGERRSAPLKGGGTPHRWRRRARRLVIVLLGLALLGTVAFFTVKPFRVGVQTLAVVPELLDIGPKPLSALVPAPERISTSYGRSRTDRLDIYVPRQAAPGTRHPAILVVLGVNRVPLDDPRVVRFASALSRLGLVVAAPESNEMKAGRVPTDEPGHLVDAFELVAARPEVDPNRIGVVGFSVGGSLALVAAADPRIADRIRYVNAFGAYADASTLLVDIATRTAVVEGGVKPWQPGEMTRRVFLELLLDAVADPAARDALRPRLEPIVLGDGPTRASRDDALASTLDADAAAVYRLATSVARAEAEAAVGLLPPATQRLLRAISPLPHSNAVRAPVFLMHDESDNAIPFSHLTPLAGSIAPERLRRTTAFRLFDHVQPGQGIGIEESPEIWKLFWHLQELLNEAL